MRKILFYFLISYSFNTWSCTMMSANGAKLPSDRVNVWVSSNSVCNEAGLNGYEIISLVSQAANQFWNTISSSRLRFVSAGFWNRNVSRFETGKLCTPDVDCSNTTVPVTTDIIVSCNDNTQNFSATTYAKTAIYLDGGKITGANVLINNVSNSVFGNLSMRQKLWVIAHELGHAAGLGHTKNNANLMYYTLAPTRVALGQEDYWGMSYLYPAQQDGCGLVGSIKTEQTPRNDWWLSFLIGISILISVIIIQKLLLKRFKFIF